MLTRAVMIPGLELALEYDQNIILESEIGGIITALLSPLCQACFLSSQNNNKPEGDVCRVCISISEFHMVISGGLCLGLFPCSCDRIVSVASVKVEYKREEQEQPPLQVRVQRLRRARATAACCSPASRRSTRRTPKTPKTPKTLKLIYESYPYFPTEGLRLLNL